MSRRSSVLIVTCCLVIVVVVSLVFMVNYWTLKSRVARLELTDDAALVKNASESGPHHIRTVSVARRDSIETIQRLRQLLNERTEFQRQQKTRLNRHIDENEKMQAEYDRLSSDHEALREQYFQLWRDTDSSLMTLVDMFEEGTNPLEAESSLDNNDAAVAVSENEQMRAEIEILEWELQEATDRISDLEVTANEVSLISNAASMAFVEMGTTSVPFLTELLADRETAEVRAWAAWLLGTIGPPASEAKARLVELLVDKNSVVSKTAQEALNRIDVGK